MTIHFQLNLGDAPSIGILLDGKVVATIYADGEDAIELQSDHIQTIRHDDEGSRFSPPIPNIRIAFVNGE